jgi:hypothetical protein
MSIAGDYEFFSRPEWAGCERPTGLSFRAQRQMQPDFMYAAVASGEVDVIAGYTSDGLIANTIWWRWTIQGTRSRPTTRWCCSRRSAPTTTACARRCAAARQDRHRHDARSQPARRRQ